MTSVTIDKIGNGFMRRRPQQQPAADHDRQPHRHPAHRRQVRRQLRRAGWLEVVRTLNDHGIETEAPIEVASGPERGRIALRAGEMGSACSRRPSR